MEILIAYLTFLRIKELISIIITIFASEIKVL